MLATLISLGAARVFHALPLQPSKIPLAIDTRKWTVKHQQEADVSAGIRARGGRLRLQDIEGKVALTKSFREEIPPSAALRLIEAEKHALRSLGILAGQTGVIVAPGLVAASSDTITMDYLSGATSLTSLALRTEVRPEFEAVARTLGRRLALVHSQVGASFVSAFEHAVLLPVDEQTYANATLGSLLFWARVHQDEDLSRLHAAVVAEARLGEEFIHGDLKMDNILISADDQIRIIDWECSGRGSAEIDIGAYLASVLFLAALQQSSSASAGTVGFARKAAEALRICGVLVQEYEASSSLDLLLVAKCAGSSLLARTQRFMDGMIEWNRTAELAWLMAEFALKTPQNLASALLRERLRAA